MPLLSCFLGLFPVEIYDICKVCLSLTSSFMWRIYFGLQGSFCHFCFIPWWIIGTITLEAALYCLVSMKFLTCDFFGGRIMTTTDFFVAIANYWHKCLCVYHLSKDLVLQVSYSLLAHGTVAGNQSGAGTGVCFHWSGSNRILGVLKSQKQPIWRSLCEPFAESNLSFLSPWLISVVFFCRKLHCVLSL